MPTSSLSRLLPLLRASSQSIQRLIIIAIVERFLERGDHGIILVMVTSWNSRIQGPFREVSIGLEAERKAVIKDIFQVDDEAVADKDRWLIQCVQRWMGRSVKTDSPSLIFLIPKHVPSTGITTPKAKAVELTN